MIESSNIKMFSFKSQFIKTNVTAIKTINNFILLGIGTTVYVYNKNSSILINKLVIANTRGENIHGIAVFQNKIFIYGGQFMTLFKVNEDFTQFEELANNILLDWILDAKWINDGEEIATVSLQNKLYVWDSVLKPNQVIQCEEKCILYSAHICYGQYRDLIILSGTVFSEILIWKPSKRKNNTATVLKRLQKHNGVIFSLHYNEYAGYICSSSDDRSAVLWKVNKGDLGSEIEQEVIDITPKCQVSGHSSRIFRCRVLKNHFVTAGEDSILNIWTFDGKRIKKIETHQGGPIWSLDTDEEENSIMTGGGDGGVSMFPINVEPVKKKLILPNEEKPKMVGILRSLNLVVFSENGSLYVYSKSRNEWNKVREHSDLKNYVVMQVSECRRLIALAGLSGEIHVYHEHQDRICLVSSWRTSNRSRIASLHWLTCKSFLICQDDGNMTLFYLKQASLVPLSKFILPPSSERCSTSAVVSNGKIIIGDRRGHIHFYKIGNVNPVQSLRKAHSHLGVTKLIMRNSNIGQNNEIISLGRNAVVKHFSMSDDGLELISSDKLPFTWLLDIFGNILIAFSSKNFVVWDCDSKRVLFETFCGGGHRSWDFLKSREGLTFVFVKDKVINEVQLDMCHSMPNNLIKGYHSKEINSIEILKGVSEYILISGGEDTKLRIGSVQLDGAQFRSHITLKSHLSSIRSLTVHKLECREMDKEMYLLFSAGGRAQILCWKLECFFVKVALRDIICSQQYSYHNLIGSKESEMRIMSLCVAEITNKIVLFAACSDGNIQMFHLEQNKNFLLKFLKNIFYELKCVLLVSHLKILQRDVLISMATDGKLVFWDVSDIFTNAECRPFESVQAHQSGINTFSIQKLGNNRFLFLTGGDDNSIVINYAEFFMTQNNLRMKKIDKFVDVTSHWAQITGSFLNENYFMTSSVDQRLVIFRWKIKEEKIVCECISKYNTAVTDIKGMICFKNCELDVFLYGNGIELVQVIDK